MLEFVTVMRRLKLGVKSKGRKRQSGHFVDRAGAVGRDDTVHTCREND